MTIGAFAVEQAVYAMGISALHGRACEAKARHETAFSRLVNARASELGDEPRFIKIRIKGDIACARLQFGDAVTVHWN